MAKPNANCAMCGEPVLMAKGVGGGTIALDMKHDQHYVDVSPTSTAVTGVKVVSLTTVWTEHSRVCKGDDDS